MQHLPHRTQVEHRDRERFAEEVHQVDLAEGSLIRGPEIVICALAKASRSWSAENGFSR